MFCCLLCGNSLVPLRCCREMRARSCSRCFCLCLSLSALEIEASERKRRYSFVTCAVIGWIFPASLFNGRSLLVSKTTYLTLQSFTCYHIFNMMWVNIISAQAILYVMLCFELDINADFMWHDCVRVSIGNDMRLYSVHEHQIYTSAFDWQAVQKLAHEPKALRGLTCTSTAKKH